jgi:thymidylate kinase
MVHVHQLSLGARTDQLRAARRVTGNGNLRHLGAHVRAAEILFVDRFHISTQAYQKQMYGKGYDFHWLEERLLPLNFRIVFCTRSPESFEATRAERLKVSGNPAQYKDLTPFIHEQERMRELVAKSILPSLTLDISDNNIPAAVERVADWLEASGGLYMPD